MHKITTIPTKPHHNRDDGSLESGDITVIDNVGRIIGGTHICVFGSGRREHGGPIIDEPFAACIQHCTVIDNYGGTGAELERNPLKLVIGSLVRVEGFPGVWMLAHRDQRRYQGAGFRLIPFDAAPGKYGHDAESRDAVEVIEDEPMFEAVGLLEYDAATDKLTEYDEPDLLERIHRVQGQIEVAEATYDEYEMVEAAYKLSALVNDLVAEAESLRALVKELSN